MSYRDLLRNLEARPLRERFNARVRRDAGGVLGLSGTILATQAASLQGYYPCDDASGALTDLSPSANHLSAVGTGHTYGIAGQDGDAVNGNATGGWNNAGSSGALTPFLPGDNGTTMLAIVRPQGSLDTARLFGCGGTELAWFEVLQWPTTGNRSIESSGSNVSSNSIINVVANLLPDTDWHLIGLRATVAGVGGPGGPDDLDVFVDTDTPTKIDDTTWETIPDTNEIDDVFINALLFNDADAADYGRWDIQHVAFWNTSLTDTEISDIATAAGL